MPKLCVLLVLAYHLPAIGQNSDKWPHVFGRFNGYFGYPYTFYKRIGSRCLPLLHRILVFVGSPPKKCM